MKIDCFNDSSAQGEYFSLDLDEWEEIECSIMNEEWLNVGRRYAKKDVRVFVKSCPEDRYKICNSFIMFDRKVWSELRRVRGSKRGLPLGISSNGAVWVGKRLECESYKVFIKR